MQHLIKKQELLLRIAPGLEPFGIQHAASSYYRDRLLPILERVFDELSAEDEVIRIDRLVIDLGPIAEKSLWGGSPDDDLYAVIREEVLRVVRGESPDAGLSRAALRENILSQWWYYMEKGRLPWNATEPAPAWYQGVLEMLSVDYGSVTRLRRMLESNAGFLQRMSYQHTDEFLETLTGILTGVRQPLLGQRVEDLCFLSRWLEKTYREMTDVTAAGRRRAPEERAMLIETLHRWVKTHALFLSLSGAGRKASVWKLLLLEAAVRPAEMKAGDAGTVLVRRFLLPGDLVIRKLLREAGLDLPALWFSVKDDGVIDDNTIKGSAIGDERADKDDRMALSGESAGEAAIKDAGQATAADEPGGDGFEDGGGYEEPAESANGFTESANGIVDEEGLYGRHAGLILLHPFLSTFFHRCGWWDGGGFVSLAARQQAVFLLHYLATGEKEAPEYELLFPKLLCGYALGAPLPGSMDIPEAAFEEGEVLLQNVLLRWEKLKNTSIAGLRESFLQRTGKLINRNGRMVLLLEISAIDVLLDYLPWGLGIVKLPWLKELLFVEWR